MFKCIAKYSKTIDSHKLMKTISLWVDSQNSNGTKLKTAKYLKTIDSHKPMKTISLWVDSQNYNGTKLKRATTNKGNMLKKVWFSSQYLKTAETYVVKQKAA